MDLDLGLAFALVGEQRYQAVAERLRTAGFTMDVNEEGQPTRQRWRISNPPVTVDFLIEPENSAEAQAGRLFPLARDWAAIIAPGLHLAFKNNETATLAGRTITGETATGPFEFAGQAPLWCSRHSLSTFAGRTRMRTICSICFGIMAETFQTLRHSCVRCFRTRARQRHWSTCEPISRIRKQSDPGASRNSCTGGLIQKSRLMPLASFGGSFRSADHDYHSRFAL